MTHGQKLSILLARASSIAYALPGTTSNDECRCEGLPGWRDAPGFPLTGSKEGERVGEEKERR